LEFEGENLRNAEDDGYEHYRFIRDRFNESYHPLDFLFLSRAGFNGMMRFNKSGGWNIPFCKKPNRFTPAYITKIVNQIKAVAEIIQPGWKFSNTEFFKIITMAEENDIIYCDPPYLGRYVDYYNGWTEREEEVLFECLLNTKARFILSTWHHNKFRENKMIRKFWNKFNIVTRDHFYHSGGKIENRKSIVEALVFNFETNILNHNHGIVNRPEQLKLFEKAPVYIKE
jgi:DNA adenine methylase